ncbi:MAG: aconitate hydratase, partial [Oscillospiraceae bacterium]|nr:aconitate hydratase [Oscillospiraceae bacterium]
VANLINAGILPLTFENEADYDRVSMWDELGLPNVREMLQKDEALILENKTTGETLSLTSGFSKRQTDILLAGGLLNYTKEQN